MSQAVIEVFIIATTIATAAAYNSTNSTSKDCKQSNDFVKTKCGAKEPYKCCGSIEVCVGPVKYKTGDDQYFCSKDRTLSGQKMTKIVEIPFVFMLLDIFIVVYMVKNLQVKRNHVTKLCIGMIFFTWPLLFSEKWVFACRTAFFALFVAYLSNFEGLAKWIKKAVWVMQVFQVILLFGPNEEFFVPLYGQSTASNSELNVKTLGMDMKTCNTHYGNYFKLSKVEIGALNADPDVQYFGYCAEGFISFVQVMAMFHGFLSIVLVCVSAPHFLVSADNIKGTLVRVMPSSDKHA